MNLRTYISSFVYTQTYHRKLSSKLNSIERELGGGVGNGNGQYATLTAQSTCDILDVWPDFGKASIVLDVGAGLGRFLAHAASYAEPNAVIGVERCPLRALAGKSLLQKAFSSIEPLPSLACSYRIICKSAADLTSIEPASHVFLAWQGWDPASEMAMGKLFKESSTAKVVTIVQHGRSGTSDAEKSVEYMALCGFGEVKEIGRCPVHMVGSGGQLQSFTCLKSNCQSVSVHPNDSGLFSLPEVCIDEGRRSRHKKS